LQAGTEIARAWLPPGKWRELTPPEINLVNPKAGKKDAPDDSGAS